METSTHAFSVQASELRLNSDEVVIWSGRPSDRYTLGVILRFLADPMLVFFAACVFLFLVASKGEFSVVIVSIPFLVSTVWAALSLQRECPLIYFVTDKRCVVVFGGVLSRRPTSERSFSRDLSSSWRCSVGEGNGDVVFLREKIWKGKYRVVSVGFLGVDDVAAVARVIGVDPSLPLRDLRVSDVI
jgi:hypothetical protein